LIWPQSGPHNNFWPVSIDNEALWGSITIPSVLNIDSEIIVVFGVDKISLATLDKIWNLKVFAFH
jgi:hypothetical protein